MRNRLQKAFSQVRAEEALKAGTLERIYSRARQPKRRPLALAAACLVVLLCLGGGLFFTPVSAIGIEVNPSLKLRINRFDLVIGVEGLNRDGRRIAEETDLIFTEYGKAIDTLLADSQLREYLDDGRDMEIYVECEDERRCKKMLERVEGCVGGEGNVTCHAGSSSGHEEEHGGSHGKSHRHRGGRGSEP